MPAPKNNLEEGKAQMSLLPFDVLRKYIVPAYEEWLVKYEKESWRKGFNTSVMMDAAISHLEEFYYEGKNYDISSITNKHHLSGVVFCCLSMLYSLENFPELDDRHCKIMPSDKQDKHAKIGKNEVKLHRLGEIGHKPPRDPFRMEDIGQDPLKGTIEGLS